ncbi:DinB family protein [Nocardioides panzhihuensis]|uniref:Putative damage-inducible protein DinB n=1 Tax=Nocardioides panzhihuensis TaxID=860243 RepID=A0A7Z0IQ64_9ACTN|nr:DinB family protein [Nocardioides panzhihuensis]NYI75440.1 putative damage-inducible protein DinB [Nocardioides panzhihuensis]
MTATAATATETVTETATLSRERADLLETLANHRRFLRYTVRDLTDEQARLAPTASVLTLGGLIKHVAAVERGWADFIVRGTVAQEITPEKYAEFAADFVLAEDETLAGVLDAYEEIAAATDELVRTADLDADHPLPEAPWFEAGERWSNRRALTHILAETTQHAGHADIIRETIDGQKTMG